MFANGSTAIELARRVTSLPAAAAAPAAVSAGVSRTSCTAPDDEHGRNPGKGRQKQIVAAGERQCGGCRLGARRQRTTDTARTDLEEPAKDEGDRKAGHRRPGQCPNRSIRNPKSREHDVRNLQRQPGTEHVKRGRAKHLAAARFAIELHDRSPDFAHGSWP